MADGENVNNKITIEGEGEILAILKRIADAGADAFDRIDKAAGGLVQSSAKTEEGLARVESQANSLGKSMRNVFEGVKDVAGGLSGLVKATGVAVTGLFAVTKAGAEAADSARDAASALGISIKEYGRLSFALSQSGGNIQTARVALNRLAESVNNANEGNKEATELFRKLGINVRGLNGSARNSAEVLGDIAETFKDMDDGAEKTALAIQLFGQRAGPQLIPLLNEGRKGIAALGDDAEKLGIVFDKAGGELGDKFGDALNRFHASVQGVVIAISKLFADDFADAFNAVADVIAANRGTIVSILTFIRASFLATFNALKDVALPVAKQVYAALQKLATAFNNAFGTQISAQGIIVVGVFGGLAVAAVTLAKALLTLIPGLSTIAGILTGFPQILGLVTGSLKILTGGVGLFFNALRLGMTLFGGWQIALLAIGVALGYLITKFLLAQDWPAVWKRISETVIKTFQNITAFLSGIWQAIIDGANAVWVSIAAGAQAGLASIGQLFTDFGTSLAGLWTAIQGVAQNVWGFIVNGANNAVDTMVGAFTGLKDKVIAAFTAVRDFVNAVWQQIQSKYSKIFGEDNAAFAGAQGRAGGGRIWGPGTGTSDSVPIWASNGEFMMRAAAVKKYGMGFMHAINSMRLSPPEFALGGLISFAAPQPRFAYAEGGAINTGSKNVLNLTIGGEKFPGLSATDETMDRLQRFSVKQQVRSGGRKPAWFK